MTVRLKLFLIALVLTVYYMTEYYYLQVYSLIVIYKSRNYSIH